MAIRFQYNKTELQRLNKQLRVREHALPILKNKEAALRMEVKKARRAAEQLEQQLVNRYRELESMADLWQEFDFDLVEVERIHQKTRKIAGVSIPVLDHLEFRSKHLRLFHQPAWFPAGRVLLEKMVTLAVERAFLLRQMELLDQARKKTTQKVNLYEKVQIPGYEEAIRKIKRFLEDQENLAKAAQKIIKNRREAKSAGS
jgi:V/A-type H+-transporting ATPase subunit D